MTMASELADYLATNIAELTRGTNMFDYLLPDETDTDTYTLRQTGGTTDNEALIEYPTFQVLARGVKNDIATPQDVIRKIYDFLIPAERCAKPLNLHITTTNWRFMMFRSIQAPSPIGFDDRDRPLFVFNVEANVTPVV